MSLFHTSQGDAADDPALREHKDDQHRDDDHDGRRRREVKLLGMLVGVS
nr:hypothetical protein [Anaerolineae bacterium]